MLCVLCVWAWGRENSYQVRPPGGGWGNPCLESNLVRAVSIILNKRPWTKLCVCVCVCVCVCENYYYLNTVSKRNRYSLASYYFLKDCMRPGMKSTTNNPKGESTMIVTGYVLESLRHTH